MRGGGEGGKVEWEGGRDDGNVWIDLVILFTCWISMGRRI
jgi:hypothetical protein